MILNIYSLVVNLENTCFYKYQDELSNKPLVGNVRCMAKHLVTKDLAVDSNMFNHLNLQQLPAAKKASAVQN